MSVLMIPVSYCLLTST